MSEFSKNLKFFVEHGVPRAEAVTLARVEIDADNLEFEAFWYDDDRHWKDDGRYYERIHVYTQSDVNQRTGEVKPSANPLFVSGVIVLDKNPNRDPSARVHEARALHKALKKLGR